MERIGVKPNTLVQMLAMQKELLEHYIQIEGLPEYPVDLNTKEGQKLIKSFISRFIEELAEAFEQIVAAFEKVNRNQKGQQELRNYNLELADAWHFFLEILIYMGIGQDELEEICMTYMEEHPEYYNFYQPGKPFKFFLLAADFENQQQGLKVIVNRADRFMIATEQDWIDDYLLAGGRRISTDLIDQHGLLLWNITYACMKLANELKNRDWNQTQRMVNAQNIKLTLTELFMAWALYMDFIGIGEIQIVNCYAHKNQLNHNRIKEGY